MSRRRGLTEKQRAVMDDIFAGEYDEERVLEKHHLSRAVYNRWQEDELFLEEFNRRIRSAQRCSKAVLANYGSAAVTNLLHLTKSKNPETARKACLDVITFPKLIAHPEEQAKDADKSAQLPQLSDSTAAKLLQVLAEEKKKQSE